MRIISRQKAVAKFGGDISVRTVDRIAKDPRNGIKVVQLSERRVGLDEESIDNYLKRNLRTSA